MSQHPRSRDGLDWHVHTHRAGGVMWIEVTDSVSETLRDFLFLDLTIRVLDPLPVLNLSQRYERWWIGKRRHFYRKRDEGPQASWPSRFLAAIWGILKYTATGQPPAPSNVPILSPPHSTTSWQMYATELRERYAVRAEVTTDLDSVALPEPRAWQAAIHISGPPYRPLLEEILVPGGSHSLPYLGYATSDPLEPWPQVVIHSNVDFIKWFCLTVGNEVLESLMQSCDVLLFATDRHPAFAIRTDEMRRRIMEIISQLALEYQLRLVLHE